MIEPRCNQAPCHGIASAGELNLEGQTEALATLLDGMGSDPDECGPMGTRYIVPREPDASLFIDKLSTDPACGRGMPIGGAPS